MQRSILLIITCLSIATSHGQFSRTHKLEIGLGNEWNAFLSPSRLIEDEEVLRRQDLWDNGTFQALSLKNSFKVEGEKYRFKIKANGSLGIYQTTQNSNRYTLRLNPSYRLKYGSKKYLEFSPEILRKKRQGINTDNAVLATPFSFTQIKVPLGLDFYLGNKTWLKTQIGYLYKNYDKSGGEKLYYQAPFLGASLSHKWVNSSVTKKLTFSSTTQIRDYVTRSAITIDEEDEEFEEEDRFREGSRDWTYQFTNITFSISDNEDNQDITFGIYQISRIDANKRSTYHEVGPGIQFNHKWSKLAFSSSLRYTVRNYTQLSPGEGNDTPLRYNYLRSSLKLNYELKPKSSIYLRKSIVNRTSNNPTEDSFTFRDYFNAFTEIGIRFDL